MLQCIKLIMLKKLSMSTSIEKDDNSTLKSCGTQLNSILSVRHFLHRSHYATEISRIPFILPDLIMVCRSTAWNVWLMAMRIDMDNVGCNKAAISFIVLMRYTRSTRSYMYIYIYLCICTEVGKPVAYVTNACRYKSYVARDVKYTRKKTILIVAVDVASLLTNTNTNIDMLRHSALQNNIIPIYLYMRTYLPGQWKRIRSSSVGY